jgi:hypothetical protein
MLLESGSLCRFPNGVLILCNDGWIRWHCDETILMYLETIECLGVKERWYEHRFLDLNGKIVSLGGNDERNRKELSLRTMEIIS